jgi:hypothetical protein
VLGQATVPPGVQPTNTVVSSWLEQAAQAPDVPGLIDLHELYLVDEPPNAVVNYVKAHLRVGAVAGTGTSNSPNSSATDVVISLPISGPNEYLSEVTYDAVPDGSSGAELRVDAQVVWLADRPAQEDAPSDALVDVVGFSRISLDQGSSGRVAVELSGRRTTELRKVLDALPLAPQPTCMEDSLIYQIVFRPGPGLRPSFEADGYECGATVLVTESGRSMSPLHDTDCSLLRAVIGILPAHEANGTRLSGRSCI